jgi:hypothetical protein
MKIHRGKDKIRDELFGRSISNPYKCGGRFSLKSMREHEKSNIHLNYLAILGV